MPDETYLEACPPPWQAFPYIAAGDLVQHMKQGAAEHWLQNVWRPFWSGLSAEQKDVYLKHWSASPQWRDALEVFVDDPSLDLEADARESKEYLAQWRETTSQRPSFWRRLLRRSR
jgi:hypothetical protein